MSKPYKDFRPPFVEEQAPKGSYREIFKWGSPTGYKVPKETLYKLIKEIFELTDEDFKEPMDLGYEQVDYDIPIKLTEAQIAELSKIVGPENLKKDPYSRLSVAYGKTMYDILRLRRKVVENVPDVVLYPANKEQIEKIVAYVSAEKIPLYVYGGGSSVTRGTECMKGGVSLDMRKNFNKVIKFNEINQTITVEAGMSGSASKKCS
jgi:alkyldihydroxyacetonephosphate synthase